MEKILKKYRTIPVHLYVKRNADRQLEQIISDMESPGYVLVARQMGKTNLLFNAERNLENAKRIFTYIDLSNLFEEERNCYRNIIDNVIEQNEKYLEQIEPRIKEIRSSDLEPHKEYSRSLRAILNCFPGDIIIILDEIDALRSINYSDHIFAQIRSTYFQRKPFPEYCRLTYILSGVIEPTDLIKDKNKSPFNIGEKIYLNDFTIDEHNEFITKSQLNIDKNISDYIFHWTNGNPRLTFDICSEIENYIIESQNINKKVVDEIIHEKYLRNFDIPPIDHIRELLKSNSTIQNAVILMHQGKTNITDDIRKKLYLYGITDSTDKLTIKNKIIEKSISLEWINQLLNDADKIYKRAMSQYKNKEYMNSIITFNQLLSESKVKNLSLDMIESCNYYIGRSYHYLRDYKQSVNYLENEYTDVKRKRNARSILGTSLLQIDLEKGLNILNDIIKYEIDDWAYHNALLQLGVYETKTNEERALELFKRLNKSTSRAENNYEILEDLNKIRTLSFYYQFSIQNKKNLTKETSFILNEAIKYAAPDDSLFFMYQLYLLNNNNREAGYDIVLKIIQEKINFSDEKSYEITFIESDLFQYIDLVFDNKNLFEKIINYTIDVIYKNRKNKYELLYNISRISNENSVGYLKIIEEDSEVLDNILYMKTMRDLSFHMKDNMYHFFKYFNIYTQLFQYYEEDIVEDDIYPFIYGIKLRIDNKEYIKALEISEFIENKINIAQNKHLNAEFAIITYFKALSYNAVKNIDKAIIYAKESLSIIDNYEAELGLVIEKEGFQIIKNNLNKIVNLKKNTNKIMKYGRNEIIKVEYLDKSTVEAKYKKLEHDLIQKRCKIIEKK